MLSQALRAAKILEWHHTLLFQGTYHLGKMLKAHKRGYFFTCVLTLGGYFILK